MSTKWHGFASSVRGSGHIRRNIPCQDAAGVILENYPSVIVCDGRGSASLSQFGAQGAVKAFRTQCSILEPFLAGILDSEEANEEKWTKFCRIMYRTLMQVKLELAVEHGCEEKAFDFTVAFAVAGKNHIGCFQVGDGALVISRNGETSTVFMPDKGEYANQTHFLRPGGEDRDDFHSALISAEDVDGISATSDGPEHLMFQLSTMTPGKIFKCLFSDLIDEELEEQDLRDYLTRPAWDNDPRGTDDRSIAIIGRKLPVKEETKVDSSEDVMENVVFETENPETEKPSEVPVEEDVKDDQETAGGISVNEMHPVDTVQDASTVKVDEAGLQGQVEADLEAVNPAEPPQNKNATNNENTCVKGEGEADSSTSFPQASLEKTCIRGRENGVLKAGMSKYEKNVFLILVAVLFIVGTVYVYNLNQLLKKYNNEISELETSQQDLFERIQTMEMKQHEQTGILFVHTP